MASITGLSGDSLPLPRSTWHEKHYAAVDVKNVDSGLKAGTKSLKTLTLESQVSQKAGGDNSNKSLVNILIPPVVETPAQGPPVLTASSNESSRPSVRASSDDSQSFGSSVDIEA